eukprot:scaffold4.g4643.t1
MPYAGTPGTPPQPALAAGMDLDYRPVHPAKQPEWAAIARRHWTEYAGLAVLIVLLAWSENWQPYRHVIYKTSDHELWRYSYPLRTNHVPAWAVPCIAVFGPTLAIGAALAAGRISRMEAHHAILMATCCVATTGLLTNWVKASVPRPRPGPPPSRIVLPRGCAAHAGHTSWSTSGLGYLTLWLLGKLRCFDGSAQPLRFVASLLPLLGAAFIGITRLQDYWHHTEDVLAGFTLGLIMAFCFYRMVYAPVTSLHAGQLTAAVRASSPQLAGQGSKFALPGGGSDGEMELAMGPGGGGTAAEQV